MQQILLLLCLFYAFGARCSEALPSNTQIISVELDPDFGLQNPRSTWDLRGNELMEEAKLLRKVLLAKEMGEDVGK